MAHTFDLSTTRGKIRFLLADKRAESAWFTDAEIDHAYTQGGTVDGAVAYLQRVLIAGHAHKGDIGRARVLLDALAIVGGQLPTVTVGEGAALPTDDAYEAP